MKTELTIAVGNQIIYGLSYTYANAIDLLALIGSSGYLEVSLKNGSAAAILDVRIGDTVTVK